jgi:hypothetical protein
MKRTSPIQTQPVPVWSSNLPYWTNTQRRRARRSGLPGMRKLREIRASRRERATPGT